MSRRTIRIALLALAPCVAAAAEPHPFDGRWQTTVSCDNERDALGYSYRFMSEVKDGHLHGRHGVEGEPGSLVIDGRIAPDGIARLYAQGRTGSKEFVPGRDTPRGTGYGYHIDARFEDSRAKGRRVEGRPCSVEFEKEMGDK